MSRRLEQEVAACASASATKDPRFPALTLRELDDVRLEISVLSSPARVSSDDELDADRYGVVVQSGDRRGVLLPAVDGVTSLLLPME